MQVCGTHVTVQAAALEVMSKASHFSVFQGPLEPERHNKLGLQRFLYNHEFLAITTSATNKEVSFLLVWIECGCGHDPSTTSPDYIPI